jgi:alpha-tubulin suppressor-like RCC1 family protein
MANSGKVIAWGYNNLGQSSVPSYISSGGIVAVAGGREHSIALSSSGEVIAWGGSQFIDVPDAAKNDVVAIASGWYHSLALKSDGSVVSWGYKADVPQGLPSFKQICAGELFSIGITQSGEVVAWGEHAPTIPESAKSDVVMVDCSKHNVIVVKSTGEVIPFGGFSFETMPETASGDVAKVAAGFGHYFVVKKDGSVVSWKYDHMYHEELPGVLNQGGVQDIFAGEDFMVIFEDNGMISVHGQNWCGQNNIPVEAVNIKSLAVGMHHTLAIV